MTDQLSLIRDLIDSADVAMYLKDADGTVLAVNNRVAEMWGTTKDALIGKMDPDFANKEDARRIHEMDRKVQAANKPMTFRLTLSTPRGQVELYDHKFPVNLDGHPGAIGGLAIEVDKLA